MRNKFLFFLLSFSFFFGIILLFTHGLFNNFFEQDEWGAIGVTIYSNNLPWWNFFISRGVHFSPIGFILWSLLYKFFGLQAEYYTLVHLLMHALASFLVFVLSSKLSGSRKIGLLTGILFATNGRANEAFTHLAINTTVGVFIFISLFFVYLVDIKNKYFTKLNVFILFIIFLAAVFIREEGIMILPMFIVYLLIFDKEKINKRNTKPFLGMFIGLILFLILRYASQLLNTTFIPDASMASCGSVLYNLIMLPIKLVVQNIIEGVKILNFLLTNGPRIYPDMQVSVLESYPVFMDFAYTFLFTLVILIFTFWMIFLKNKKILNLVLFSICWILCNAFILAFVGRRLYMVEERYLYFSSFPVLFLISIFVFSLFKSCSGYKILNIVKKIVSISFIVFLVGTSYFSIQSAVKYKTFNGEARRSLLNSILTVHPTIPNNTIFYFQCKDICHRNELFGLSSAWVLPFSSGPGWNILVLYSQKQEEIWSKFLTDDFLLNLSSQGYKRIDNDGFGYFIDKNLLIKTLKENDIDSNIVVALEYNEENFTINDITPEIRDELNKK